MYSLRYVSISKAPADTNREHNAYHVDFTIAQMFCGLKREHKQHPSTIACKQVQGIHKQKGSTRNIWKCKNVSTGVALG